jgi:redox-sensitive bicupin YhaK (pirin superfamily)
MIALLRANERHHDSGRNREAWNTFEPDHGFGMLEFLDENRLPPLASLPPREDHDAEIVTYVRDGELAYEDSLGRSGIVQAGEFRRLTAARGIHHSERNASRTEPAHVFQLWVRPAVGDVEPCHEQRRFSAAQRRDLLCVVASPDGQAGSLRIRQDAFILSAMLARGHHVIRELSLSRRAWLHVVQGEVAIGVHVLATGDGAGVTGERAISFTAREEAEVLLLDLGADLRRSSITGDESRSSA